MQNNPETLLERARELKEEALRIIYSRLELNETIVFPSPDPLEGTSFHFYCIKNLDYDCYCAESLTRNNAREVWIKGVNAKDETEGVRLLSLRWDELVHLAEFLIKHKL